MIRAIAFIVYQKARFLTDNLICRLFTNIKYEIAHTSESQAVPEGESLERHASGLMAWYPAWSEFAPR